MNEYIASVCKEAVDTYGPDKQMRKAIEEMAELTKEICKAGQNMEAGRELNKTELTEEVADVEIMLQQIKYMFDLQTLDILKVKMQKMEKLQEKINKRKERATPHEQAKV